jgi:segregation and condensation protein B
MAEIKDKVEAVLFAVGRKIDIEEISKITKITEKAQIEEALQQLKQDYETRQGPIALTQQGTVWKMGVADSHIPTVQNIMSDTELDRQTMETLAVIAYKAPVLQSDVIKIRTNKAYDHLKLLEELGYIARVPKGRSKLITLSQYFFKYFDVPSENMKQMFNTVQEGEKLVEKKEQELKEIKEKIKEIEELKSQKKDEEKKEEQTHEQELAKVDETLLNEGVLQTTTEEAKKEPYEIEIEEMEKLQKEKKKLKKEKEKRKKET